MRLKDTATKEKEKSRRAYLSSANLVLRDLTLPCCHLHQVSLVVIDGPPPDSPAGQVLEQLEPHGWPSVVSQGGQPLPLVLVSELNRPLGDLVRVPGRIVDRLAEEVVVIDHSRNRSVDDGRRGDGGLFCRRGRRLRAAGAWPAGSFGWRVSLTQRLELVVPVQRTEQLVQRRKSRDRGRDRGRGRKQEKAWKRRQGGLWLRAPTTAEEELFTR